MRNYLKVFKLRQFSPIDEEGNTEQPEEHFFFFDDSNFEETEITTHQALNMAVKMGFYSRVAAFRFTGGMLDTIPEIGW